MLDSTGRPISGSSFAQIELNGVQIGTEDDFCDDAKSEVSIDSRLEIEAAATNGTTEAGNDTGGGPRATLSPEERRTILNGRRRLQLVAFTLPFVYIGIELLLGVVPALKGASGLAIGLMYGLSLVFVPLILIFMNHFLTTRPFRLNGTLVPIVLCAGTCPWIAIFTSVAVGFAVPYYRQTTFPELTLSRPFESSLEDNSEVSALASFRDTNGGFKLRLADDVYPELKFAKKANVNTDGSTSSPRFCCIAPLMTRSVRTASYVMAVKCGGNCQRELETVFPATTRTALSDKWVGDSHRALLFRLLENDFVQSIFDLCSCLF
ncbi:MAG: hypothetical protein MHM6MM_004513 [Cercozoa sp. M6MM]